MRNRAAKFLAGLLTATALIVVLAGLTSYFSVSLWEVGCDWTSPGGGDSVVYAAGLASSAGELVIGFSSRPKALEDIEDKDMSAPTVPGEEYHRYWRRWFFHFWRHHPAPTAWWFRIHSETFQQRLLPRPATGSAVAAAASYPVHDAEVGIPYWLPMLLVAVYPFYCLTDLPARRRRKRFAAGQCIACGYDLRHTPDRCPECGLTPAGIPPDSYPARVMRPLIAFEADAWHRLLPYLLTLALIIGTAYLTYSRYYRR